MTMSIFARTEALRDINALAYFLCSHIVVMLPLILLKVMDLLILAIGGPHCLLSISDSFLKHLHVLTVLLIRLAHDLKVMRWHQSLWLTHILARYALIGDISCGLSGLTHAELEQLLDVLRRNFWRGTLTDLNDLALRVVVRLRHILLHDARTVIRSMVYLVRMMRAVSAARTLA